MRSDIELKQLWESQNQEHDSRLIDGKGGDTDD